MHPFFLVCFKDAATESLTTVRPYSNEIHAQAQLWLKKDPKASYEAWKKCLPARCKDPIRTTYGTFWYFLLMICLLITMILS